MPSTFTNTLVKVGIANTAVYTAVQKSIIIGCVITNTTDASLPCSVFIRQGGIDTYIVKNLRVKRGMNAEVVSGKIVLKANDQLLSVTAVANGFDLAVSILAGVD